MPKEQNRLFCIPFDLTVYLLAVALAFELLLEKFFPAPVELLLEKFFPAPDQDALAAMVLSYLEAVAFLTYRAYCHKIFYQVRVLPTQVYRVHS